MHNQLTRLRAMIVEYPPSTDQVVESGEGLLFKVWREIYHGGSSN